MSKGVLMDEGGWQKGQELVFNFGWPRKETTYKDVDRSSYDGLDLKCNTNLISLAETAKLNQQKQTCDSCDMQLPPKWQHSKGPKGQGAYTNDGGTKTVQFKETPPESEEPTQTNQDGIGASDCYVDFKPPTLLTQDSEEKDDAGSVAPVQGIKLPTSAMEQVLEVNDELLEEISPYDAEPSIVAIDGCR
eukprot:8620920-Ditylum_brightwellii.AAC.1